MLCLRSSLTCGYVVYWSPDAVSENLTAVEVCLSCTCHFVPVSRAFTQISVVFWCSGMLILDLRVLLTRMFVRVLWPLAVLLMLLQCA